MACCRPGGSLPDPKVLSAPTTPSDTPGHPQQPDQTQAQKDTEEVFFSGEKLYVG